MNLSLKIGDTLKIDGEDVFVLKGVTDNVAIFENDGLTQAINIGSAWVIGPGDECVTVREIRKSGVECGIPDWLGEQFEVEIAEPEDLFPVALYVSYYTHPEYIGDHVGDVCRWWDGK